MAITLLVARQLASVCTHKVLRYNIRIVKMVPRGLEPRTLRLLAVRSDQLSYETVCYGTGWVYLNVDINDSSVYKSTKNV